jgi:hypothetical protein
MFKKMLLDYGKKFTDQWGAADTDELIAHWSQEMAGYSGGEIARGLAAMAAKDWPPTLPEFKKMCRPPVSATEAYWEAMAGLQARAAGRLGEWSHPAIFWAAMPLRTLLASEGFDVVRSRWERALSESLARGEWEAIPAPMAALAAPGRASTSKEEAKLRLQGLGAAGLLKRTVSPSEGRTWAAKLIARAAAGEQGIELFPLTLARQVVEGV